MHGIVLLALSLLLAGCQTLSYQEPQSGPRARVRFATNATNIVVLQTYEDANCQVNEQEWMRLVARNLVNPNPKRLGIPRWRFHDNGAKEVYVSAARTLHGMFTSGEEDKGVFRSTSYRCGVVFSVTFKEGMDYEVEFLPGRTSCSVNISEIVDRGGTVTVSHVATFDNRVPAARSGCLEKFKHPTRVF